MKSSAFPADKEFVFVVDFTWNNGRLAILEMGDYYRSCISGLDHLRKVEGKAPLDKEIKASIQTTYPDAICLYDQSIPWSCAIELDDYNQGMSYRYNMKDFSTVKRLLWARAALPDALQPLRGLVACTRLGLDIRAAIHLESILKASQHFRLLNYPSGGLYYSCINKAAFHLFNQGSDIVPATCLIDLCDFDKNRVNAFLEKFNDKQFVIKPTDQSQGRGVVVTSREDILAFLSRLNDYRCGRTRAGTNMQGDYWYDATDRFLLIQTCCPSKKIRGGYHPTGRLVMRATFSDQTAIEYLGGYWKLPAAISEVPSTSSIVSDVHGDDEPNVAKMDQEDWAAIIHAMDESFSPILNRMFCTSAVEMARLFEQHPDPVMRGYGEYNYQAFATVAKITSIEDRLDELADAGARCFERLEYGSPGSMENRHHFVSAVLGLLSDIPHVSSVTLRAGIYQQLDVACEQTALQEVTSDDIISESRITEASERLPSIDHVSTLFHSTPHKAKVRVADKSQSWFPCNIL